MRIRQFVRKVTNRTTLALERLWVSWALWECSVARERHVKEYDHAPAKITEGLTAPRRRAAAGDPGSDIFRASRREPVVSRESSPRVTGRTRCRMQWIFLAALFETTSPEQRDRDRGAQSTPWESILILGYQLFSRFDQFRCFPSTVFFLHHRGSEIPMEKLSRVLLNPVKGHTFYYKRYQASYCL